MSMFRRSLYFFILFLIFWQCGPQNERRENRSVFNYNEMNGVTSLDPAAASNFENISVVNQLYEGLLQMDDSLNILPAIAKQYSLSPDGKKYIFHLRQDVYFHDDACFPEQKGRKVKASDFIFSFNRLFDSKVSSATSLVDLIDRDSNTAFKGFEAPDDSTFILYLRQPFSAFLNILTMKYFSVIPHEAITYYQQNFRSHAVGTGPFVFKTWQEGSRLILLKNANYYEKDAEGRPLPYLDAMTVSFMRDKETAFMELLNGKFDMLSGADAFNTNEVLDKEGRLRELYEKKFALQKSKFLKTDYIGILVDQDLPLVKNSPLRLKAIRQALNYGFDRKKLIRFLRNNVGIAASSGFIPPGMKSYDSSAVKGYIYDPARTARLLAEAGFPGGKGLPELTLHTTENYKEQAEFIQAELARNNIRTQISVEKASVLRQAVNAGEYLLFRKSWVADYADEENYMSLFYSKNFSPKGINFFHYYNPHFDNLYEAALTETDSEKKKKLYQEMDRLLIEDAPVITLFYDEVIRLVSHNIQHFSTNPMNLLKLKNVKKRVN